ncbi:MAG: TonB-dependent receptor plug domain-containing protein [Sulfuricaulis sp.]
MQARTTDGFNPVIERDGATYLDQKFHTHASLAPSHMQTWQKDYNALWDVEQDAWRVRVRSWEVTRGISGLFGALDPTGYTVSHLDDVDLFYHNPAYAEHWGLDAYVSLYNFDNHAINSMVYPPGSFGPGLFPSGVFDEPGYSERHERSEVSTIYSGFTSHTVRAGVGVEYGRAYDVTEIRNYTYLPNGLPKPSGSLMTLSTDQTYLPTRGRLVQYGYGQDEWSFAPDWTLTAGLRYDHYNDFGDTTNPRLALVWATRQDLTTKFLVGHAFRAPTFLDLYARNNPSVIGNPDLKPVKITTYEIAFDETWSSTVQTGLNFFYHQIENGIVSVLTPLGKMPQNENEIIGRGLEWTNTWRASSNVTVTGYYAYQRNLFAGTQSDTGFGPHNSANARIDWRFLPAWYLDTHLKWIADRKRAAIDSRPPVRDNKIVDVTLQYKPQKSWSASLSIYNLFNTDPRDPSDSSAAFYNDMPLPRHSIFAEFRMNFGKNQTQE